MASNQTPTSRRGSYLRPAKNKRNSSRSRRSPSPLPGPSVLPNSIGSPFNIVPYYDFPLKFEDLRDLKFGLHTEFKCIAYPGKHSRCVMSIREEKLNEVRNNPLSWQFMVPKQENFEKMLSVLLCDEHDTDEVRIGYVNAWSQLVDPSEHSTVYTFGSSQDNGQFPKFSPPRIIPTVRTIPRSKSDQTANSSIHVSQPHDRAQTTPSIPGANIIHGRRVSSATTGNQEDHLAPPVPTVHRKSQSINSSSSPTHRIMDGSVSIKDNVPYDESKNIMAQQREETTHNLSQLFDDKINLHDSDNSILESDVYLGSKSPDNHSPGRATHKNSKQKAKRPQKEPPKTNDIILAEKIENFMKAPINVSSKVYVVLARIGSAEYVKIGITTDLAARMTQLSTCGMFEELNVRYSSEVKYRQKVEKLIHLELDHFLWRGVCPCGTHHREWFDVNEHVAMQTVERWIDFVKHAYNSNGTLRDHWSNSLAQLKATVPKSDSEETILRIAREPGHHELRHKRYQSWLEKTKDDDLMVNRCESASAPP
jgi:hypothetical protein